MPAGSKAALSLRESFCSPASSGWNTSTAERTCGSARISVAWPPWVAMTRRMSAAPASVVEQHLDPDEAARPVVEGAALHVGGDGRDHLGSGAGRRRDAPERGIAALQHRELAQLAPERQRVLTVEVVNLAVGLEMILELAAAVGDRLGEVLDPERGERLALTAQPLVPEASHHLRLQVHGARHLEGCRHRRAQHLDGDLVGQAEQDQGCRILGRRHHLEGHLAHDRQRAPAARQAAAQVVAGDVLHDAAAGLEDLAAPVDAAHAEQVVAGSADADAAGAGQVGGEHAGDGALVRLPAVEHGELDRLEGQHLAAGGERVLDLFERRAGPRRHHHLGGLVERDAAQAFGRYVGRRVHGPADMLLGAPAQHRDRRVGGRRLGEHARALALIDRADVGQHLCLLTPLPALPPCGRQAGRPWPDSAATWDRTRS